MVALELVGTDCPDEQDTGRRQAANAEVEQVTGRPVRPLQVLDHHDDRPVGGLGLETVQDRFQQPRAPDLASLSGTRGLGRQRSEVAQGAEQRPIRRSVVADRRARPGEHACVECGEELGDQPGLADAGVAGDQHHRRFSGISASECPGERRHLGLAGNEPGAGIASSHGGYCGGAVEAP